MNGGEEGLEDALLHRHERHGGRAPVRGERPAPMRDADDDGDPLGLRAIGLMPMMMSDDDDSEDDGRYGKKTTHTFRVVAESQLVHAE